MSRAWVLTVLLLGLSLPGAGARSAPDLSSLREIGHFRVYPDFQDPHRFYLAPGDLEIGRDDSGRPKLRFLQLRYTGTTVYGNAGESGSHSTLTLGVRLDAPSQAEFLFLRRSLRALANLGRVELRPLPVTAFDALLVYTPIGEDPGDLTLVEDGYFESEDREEARSDQRSFWRERTFTISMNQATSTLLWDLLQKQEVAISINYAFYSRGIVSSELAQVDVQSTEKRIERELVQRLIDEGMPIAVQRPTGIAERLLARLRAERAGEEWDEDGPEAELPEQTRMVHAGATAIRVDAERWPELFERVDFNDRAPPGYAVLKVYCYDFANERRPDLFYKKVEIEAEGVGGRRIPLDAKFLYSQPDLYARTLRFPVAVHVDRPYRYRVITASRDGEMETGPWIERASWSRILDVTSAVGDGVPEGGEVEG